MVFLVLMASSRRVGSHHRGGLVRREQGHALVGDANTGAQTLRTAAVSTSAVEPTAGYRG
jgi:hypothetical protein